jgi:hypothetical protein
MKFEIPRTTLGRRRGHGTASVVCCLQNYILVTVIKCLRVFVMADFTDVMREEMRVRAGKCCSNIQLCFHLRSWILRFSVILDFVVPIILTALAGQSRKILQCSGSWIGKNPKCKIRNKHSGS